MLQVSWTGATTASRSSIGAHYRRPWLCMLLWMTRYLHAGAARGGTHRQSPTELNMSASISKSGVALSKSSHPWRTSKKARRRGTGRSGFCCQPPSKLQVPWQQCTGEGHRAPGDCEGRIMKGNAHIKNRCKIVTCPRMHVKNSVTVQGLSHASPPGHCRFQRSCITKRHSTRKTLSAQLQVDTPALALRQAGKSSKSLPQFDRIRRHSPISLRAWGSSHVPDEAQGGKGSCSGGRPPSQPSGWHQDKQLHEP